MNKKILTIAKALVAALLYYFIFNKVDLRKFGAMIWNAQVSLLLASLAILWIGHYTCIFRWRMLMRPLMPVFSLTRLLEIYCIGLFFNLAFPTAVGGDIVKVYYAGKPTRQYPESFASTFLDRDSGMLAMMMIAGFGTLLFPVHLPGIPVTPIVWISFAAFIAINIMLFIPSLHQFMTRLLHKAGMSRIAVKVDAISNAFQVMGRQPRILFNALLISIFNQLLVILVTWLSALALRVEVPLVNFLVLVPVITLVTMIPITPSGMGLREYAYTSLFGALGFAREIGLGLALLGLATMVVSAVPGGIIYIFFRNRNDLEQMAAMETNFS
jgi:uncharacterized protein (TIRG00374 family)